MQSILIRDIRQLVQVRDNTPSPLRGEALGQLPGIEDAWILLEDDRIAAFGPMETCPGRADQVIEADGGFVLPCWCDSHTHLVYAGSREGEFVDRIRGLSYEEIARKGGGILNSARLLRETPEEALFEMALARTEELIGYGTGAVEIKSGYGLTLESEMKMLRVVRKLREHSPLRIRATFLGAHAIPETYGKNREGYISELVESMIPMIADEGLAEYIDVFCDRGFFTPDETDRILKAGAARGLKAKIHANELDFSGGIQVGVANDAISVDHLEFTGEAEISALRDSNTIATLLPGTAFFLGLTYPPARDMIDAGLAVAVASDYNPGSTPSGNMPLVLSLACIKLRMTPEEAISAATVNGAAAIEWLGDLGSITVGKRANVIITRPMASLAYLPYAYGGDHIARVFLNGKAV